MFVLNYYNVLFQKVLEMPQLLNLPKMSVSQDYLGSFVKARNSFCHQPVFDPLTRTIKPLHPHPEGFDAESLSYAGEYPFKIKV